MGCETMETEDIFFNDCIVALNSYQRRDDTQIRECLDRALASSDWHLLFPTAKLHHKSSSISDHNPLLLQLFSKKKRQKFKKLFKFESMWLKDERWRIL